MPLIEWKDHFLTGVEQIDSHHRHLFDLFNRVYDNLISRVSEENLGSVFDELADYATYHFTAEERWMQANSYPGFPEHRAEHDRFSARVSEMLHDYHERQFHLSLEVLTFLKNWLENHILSSDADFGRFVNGDRPKGISIILD